MHKRLISFFLVFSLLLSLFSVSAFADDAHQHTFENKREYDLTNLPDGYQIPFTVYEAPCSRGCGYSEYSWNIFGISGKFVDKTGTPALTVYKHYREWFESTYGQNATATKVPSGIGRKDLPGYADDKGSALVDKDGWPTATYTMLLDGYDTSAGRDTVYVHSSTNKTNPGSWYQYANGGFSGSNGNVSVYCAWEGGSPYVYASVSYYYVAPVTGYYTINFAPATYFSVTKDRTGKYVYKNTWSDINTFASFGIGVQQHSSSVFGILDNTIAHTQNYSSETKYAIKGQILFCAYRSNFCLHCNSDYPYKYLSIQTSAPTLTVQDLTPSQITNNNNITINNNTWNGNIYTDNSTNLTYIYPQYTTINEKNETVTNISNTPIIYNNETKKYYTYDTITNNYYYITYEQPTTPTPSPSPSPSPSPAPTETPSPSESPTPTPTPDPGTAPTSTPKPGGSISTPETGKPGGDTGDTTGILAVLVEIRDNMIQGFLDIKAAFVAGFAELSANFTLAIENLNVNIQNTFNKKFPDQSTPETAQPTPTPSPEPTETPSPTDPPSPTPSPSPAPTGKPDSGGDTNNFWNIFIGGGSDDGTDGDHKGIFWALVSLILALIAFFTNLFAGVAYLFPFLPEGVVMTINTCLFVVFLFVIIKFIMRSK